MVTSSIGKIAAVEPNSGLMLPSGGAVGQRHLGHALAVELDELADHAVLAEHFGDR